MTIMSCGMGFWAGRLPANQRKPTSEIAPVAVAPPSRELRRRAQLVAVGVCDQRVCRPSSARRSGSRHRVRPVAPTLSTAITVPPTEMVVLVWHGVVARHSARIPPTPFEDTKLVPPRTRKLPDWLALCAGAAPLVENRTSVIRRFSDSFPEVTVQSHEQPVAAGVREQRAARAGQREVDDPAADVAGDLLGAGASDDRSPGGDRDRDVTREAVVADRRQPAGAAGPTRTPYGRRSRCGGRPSPPARSTARCRPSPAPAPRTSPSRWARRPRSRSPAWERSASVASLLELDPASTRHDETAVAPFQLGHTWVVPSLLEAAAIAGGVVGCPFHANL